ncbi:hypothetical protein MIND_00312900 [Mycena indigotica]|uniref:Protein HGH1 homolog n=1 Tax=Mycena indigotica TaxID=2126181 RepID=A0A8H6WAR4_9AGAR|nr:uncharacterized protein MIND_00312900 [Mycena indigotica]KAF7309421.1 hypothetical protein MIND_00312900 [Mycena indigotica]
MEEQLRELIPFLRDRNPQVRQIALSNLLPQTVKDAPHRSIFLSGQQGGLQAGKDKNVIRDLKILCRDQLSVAHDAFRALVNLSESAALAGSIGDPMFLYFVVSYIINPQSVLADLASMLLSNLTATPFACREITSLEIDIIPDATLPNGFFAAESRCATAPAPEPYPTGQSRSALALPLLVQAFVQGAQIEDADATSSRIRKGNLHFLASVFANITTSPAGRSFFLSPYPHQPLEQQPLEYPLAKLVPFTEHKDTIRRGGVASTLKNCAFEAPAHKVMLSPDSESVSTGSSKPTAPGVDALPYILLPLAGPEELDLEDQEKLPDALQFLPPTKVREPDQAIRLLHIETLLLLCHTRWGRDYQREHGVYEIVRATHENETVDKISEHIERLVQLLKGDEPAVEELPESETSERDGKLPETDEDEDSRIEEV